MRHTPLSHFQGSLLGAAMGNILGVNCSNRPASDPQKPWTEVTYWGFQPVEVERSLPWGTVVMGRMHRLIQSQLSGWEELPVAEISSASQPNLTFPQKQDAELGLAVTTLPLAWFYHEDANGLRWQIQHIADQEQQSLEAELGAIVVSYAIALAIRNRLQPGSLIPQLLSDLQINPLDSVLAEHLTQIQHELFGQAEQDLTRQSLSSSIWSELSPIAVAFYAFLSTPENCRLSLLRVAHLPCHSEYAYALTGALSGAYNGKAVLPPDWRRALRSVPENRSPLSLLWDVKSEVELLECAQHLFAAWSGMYNPMQCLQYSDRSAIVVAPRSIRPEIGN
ncbi:MAG: hypothetical protein HC772_11470 [Leptolyngbyaceae cyanobacterium CRU_2_3]|nr:hypothetical protein [Leptolyngbyaceae cyanobacterium CRU_2_3]